jgi:hypothetical protein
MRERSSPLRESLGNDRFGQDKRQSAFGRKPAHSCRSRNTVHPILLSPKPCANSDKTGSPNGTRSLANASNRRIGSRKNFSPSTNLIAILRQRIGKLARVQARVSKRVGATTPICGNPNSIALGEIRFVGGRRGGGSEKGGEQHQRRWLHQPLVSAIRNGSGSSQCLEVGDHRLSNAIVSDVANGGLTTASYQSARKPGSAARCAIRSGQPAASSWNDHTCPATSTSQHIKSVVISSRL